MLFGLALSALIAEFALRLVPLIPPDQLLPLPYKYDEIRRISEGDAYIAFDPLLGWTLPINTARKDHDVIYRSNRAGMRADREYTAQPPPGIRRISAFGESFTYCEEVDYSECWTAQLERQLPQTEVLNFGVPGYGPDQAWLRYEREGRDHHSCAVLIGYMTENVNRVVNRFRPFYEPAGGLVMSKPRFLLNGQGLELLPNPASSAEDLLDPEWVEETLGPNDAWYYPGVFVPDPLDWSQLVRLIRTARFNRRSEDREFTYRWAEQLARVYRAQGESFQIAGRILIEFAQRVRWDGATPVVIVFGTDVDSAAVSRGEPKAYAPLLKWLAAENIPTIDVTEAVAQQARRSGLDGLMEHHYTGRGNRVVAEALAREIPRLIAPTCERD